MIQPLQQGHTLIEEIEQSECPAPRLWWLGQSGFVVKYHQIVFYIDPYLSDSVAARFSALDLKASRERLTEAPLRPWQVRHADLVLCTHHHDTHMDEQTLRPMLNASRRARLVLPKSAAGRAYSFGIDYQRMTTTDADLRVEYFKNGDYGRIYAIPSAHEGLDYTPVGGYPYLGYLIRFGEYTIYHAGDCVPYEGLVDRLRPYNVTVALLPINGRDPARGVPGNFFIEEAAQLAADIGAQWLVPMHYDMFAFDTVDVNRFVDHMLFSRPAQRFKVFQCGESWAIPEE
ncbi:MAG: MBL fold metallo-hydrolase [Bryobacteraceae bacterium]